MMHLVPRKDYFSDFFDSFFDHDIPTTSIMKSDIYEKDDNYIIEIDIPGFNKEDIEIDLDNGYLNITATKESVNSDDKKYIRKERFYGKYQRKFYVGNIDKTKIKAKFDNGILEIALPKEEEEAKAKDIIEIE
jgi:HSP20 family molecular chaperone IbpA